LATPAEINNSIKYRRVLIKLSGEALLGNAAYGIDPAMIRRMAEEVTELASADVQVAIVLVAVISFGVQVWLLPA